MCLSIRCKVVSQFAALYSSGANLAKRSCLPAYVKKSVSKFDQIFLVHRKEYVGLLRRGRREKSETQQHFSFTQDEKLFP